MSSNNEVSEKLIYVEYGMWSNTKYVIRKIKRYKPVLLIVMLCAMVTGLVLGYYWVNL